MNSSEKSHSGLTLLELSAVLFLMALILGISLPSFTNFFESDLRKETLKIAKLIENLRTEAILQNKSFQITFDLKKNQYSVFTIDQTKTGGLLPHSVFSTPIVLPSTIQLASFKENTEDQIESRFGFKKLEFDKIFGQSYHFRIDSSGFVDLFTLKLNSETHSISLTIRNIMGEVVVSQETPL